MDSNAAWAPPNLAGVIRSRHARTLAVQHDRTWNYDDDDDDDDDDHDALWDCWASVREVI